MATITQLGGYRVLNFFFLPICLLPGYYTPLNTDSGYKSILDTKVKDITLLLFVFKYIY